MGTGGSFLRVKAAGCVKLATYVQLMPMARLREYVHPLPHTSPWRSAEVVTQRDNFTFAFTYSSVRAPAYVQRTSHILPYKPYCISCSCFQMFQVSYFVQINVILYINPQEETICVRWGLPGGHSWTAPASPFPRKCCAKKFHNVHSSMSPQPFVGRLQLLSLSQSYMQ
jgi:hypothetical protein